MTLSEIKVYMQHIKRSSLQGLCRHFDTLPETLQPMLAHWVRKGKMRECQKTVGCQKRCFACSPLDTCWYEWLDETA